MELIESNISNNFNYSLTEIREIFLTEIGSSWLIDGLYLFLIFPIGIIGFVLNLLCLIVLCKISEKLALFEYFKVYTLNASILCLMMSFNFLSRSPRYFDFSFNIIPKIHR